MKPSLLVAATVLCLAGLVRAQQSGEDSYETLVKEMLGTVEQITSTLKTITDRASAEAARPELRKLAKKMLELHKKADEWKQPDKERLERLKKDYAPKLEKAVKEFNEAVTGAKAIRGSDDALAELDELRARNAKDKEKSKDKK